MFGYITINKPELKVRELDTYQQFYCGVCRALGKRSGPASHLTLTYDMTFLAILLSDLYDCPTVWRKERCPVRPWRICGKAEDAGVSYASDMNVLLSYYNLLDDWQDDHSRKALLLSRALRPAVRRIRSEYPRQKEAVTQYMKKLRQCESSRTADLDLAAGLTGEMLGEIFAYREDVWEDRLRRLGFFLGKYIYLSDAWEDRAEDEKSGAYNPWLLVPKQQCSEEAARQILTLMMSEACRSFEQLPVVEYAPILRNILYSGVWSRFERNQSEKRGESRDGSVQGAGRQIRCHGR